MADDPNDLRRRADLYQRLAQRMTDDEAVRVIQEVARDFREQANQIEAANQKEIGSS